MNDSMERMKKATEDFSIRHEVEMALNETLGKEDLGLTVDELLTEVTTDPIFLTGVKFCIHKEIKRMLEEKGIENEAAEKEWLLALNELTFECRSQGL